MGRIIMPLYYFRPLDLQADKHDQRPLVEAEFNLVATMLFIGVGIVAFVLVMIFVVAPMLPVIDQLQF
jgi:hypothetical protein